MKRIITLVLALIMVSALFVGCNNNANNPSDSTTPTAGTTTPKPSDTTPSDTTSAKPVETTSAKPKDTTTAKPQDTTTEAPKVELPAIPEGTMVYFENFDSYADANDSDAVAKLLGWQIRNKQDGALTDNSASYAIESGRFKVTNWADGAVATPNDSYVLIANSNYMAAACQGDYTIQYDVFYTAVKSHDRYINIIENYDGCNSYNSFHLRASGYGHNQNRLFGTWNGQYDLKGSDLYAPDTDDSDGTSSIAKKLMGVDYDKTNLVLLNVPVTVRVQCSYNDGPSIWLRDNSKAGAQFVCVSKYDLGSTGAIFWNAIEEYAICLKVGGAIDGYVDNIAVWTGLGDIPADTSTTAYTTAIADYLAKVSK